jgi:hypothetical protein
MGKGGAGNAAFQQECMTLGVVCEELYGAIATPRRKCGGLVLAFAMRPLDLDDDGLCLAPRWGDPSDA